jgi:hypothetical protein
VAARGSHRSHSRPFLTDGDEKLKEIFFFFCEIFDIEFLGDLTFRFVRKARLTVPCTATSTTSVDASPAHRNAP